jgi:hypothetical protein
MINKNLKNVCGDTDIGGEMGKNEEFRMKSSE